MLATVALQHDLPDGSTHVDWLIARDEAGVQPLVTFRLDRAPGACARGDALHGERIQDHRPRYLDYEGPISGDRGSVRRLARGVAEVIEGDLDAESWSLSIRWDGAAPQLLEGIRVGHSGWVVRVR